MNFIFFVTFAASQTIEYYPGQSTANESASFDLTKDSYCFCDLYPKVSDLNCCCDSNVYLPLRRLEIIRRLHQVPRRFAQEVLHQKVHHLAAKYRRLGESGAGHPKVPDVPRVRPKPGDFQLHHHLGQYGHEQVQLLPEHPLHSPTEASEIKFKIGRKQLAAAESHRLLPLPGLLWPLPSAQVAYRPSPAAKAVLHLPHHHLLHDCWLVRQFQAAHLPESLEHKLLILRCNLPGRLSAGHRVPAQLRYARFLDQNQRPVLALHDE